MKMNLTRREMLSMSGAAAAPMILPSRLFSSVAPSKQITIGCIGMGPQGTGGNMQGCLAHSSARVVAVCDCKLSKAHDAKAIVDETYATSDCKGYQDFREILGRKDIDAVVISTPDHWHVPMSMMALRTGKHVLCEKPSITVSEGRELVQEAGKRQKVFQWGIEDRSLIKYWMLAGIARTGSIGDVHSVECCLPLQKLFEVEEPASIPEDLDWNLWLGPAPYAEYTPNATDRWRWRQKSDYSGGSLTDWGAHLCDTAQVGIGMEGHGPSEILGSGRELPKGSFVDVPSGYDILYRYSNQATIRVRDTARKIAIRFEGTQGWIQCTKWNGEMTASDMNLFRDKSFAEDPNFWPRPDREQKEFIDSVINGGETTYHVEAGHRLSTMLHLGHIAVRSEKVVHWNPEMEQFTKDAAEHEGNIVYRREARDWEKEA